MGLDLYMWRMKKGEVIDDSFDVNDRELVYGRKTWDLYDFFKEFSSTVPVEGYEEMYEISEDAWDVFYNHFSPIASLIQHHLDVYDNDEAEHELSLYRLLQYGFNKDCPYLQLGADWEAHAVLAWLEAYPEVKKAYAEGDAIFMEASY